MHTVDFRTDLIDAFDALPGDGPIVMLNLLRFREHADYAGHPQEPARTGREAYRHYIGLAMPIVEKANGRIAQMGAQIATLIAPGDERWDDFLLLEYPTRKPFIEAMRCEAYRKVSHHRTAALLDSRLIAFQSGSTSFLPPP